MLQEFEYTDNAMGTEYWIAIVCDSKECADALYRIAQEDIIGYEKRFSRFLPSSELSLLNQKKHMVVSDIFFDVTTKAQQLYRQTKGVFNPLIQIARLGYTTTFTTLGQHVSSVPDEPYNIDFSSVILDPHTSSIELQAGQRLDYGGILKGYLAERIAKKIFSHPDVVGVIVNLGGDIHAQGHDADGEPFSFQIYNPITKKSVCAVSLSNQSLATSGTYKRSWKHLGKEVHHILDRSGSKNPSSTIVSASVIHRDGAVAEAYAKVFLSLPSDAALRLCSGQDISFITTDSTGVVTTNLS